IEGAFSLACLNKSLTRDAPTPTNISTKSEPDNEKKGTLASPATAFAIKVLPVPGGPTKRAPLGIFPPKRVNLSGFFKKSTISSTSSFAPSSPATSLKVTFISWFSSNNLALDFPMLKICPPAPPAPPPILLNIKYQSKPKIKTQIKIVPKIPLNLSGGIFLEVVSKLFYCIACSISCSRSEVHQVGID